MDLKHYNEGDELQKPGDKARSLYFIQDGIVEISALFDDNQFVIERLHRGSIINYRNWFMDDEDAHVYVRFATNAIV
jgi:CRP-like cAMP-binding protein